jgi:RNA-binding protein
MPLTSQERRDLLAASHATQALVTVSADNLTEAAIAQVRACFAHHELVKARIHADTADECDAAAAELAARVPCELVKRIGRIALLYRPAPS